jgi:WD40 repeat protein
MTAAAVIGRSSSRPVPIGRPRTPVSHRWPANRCHCRICLPSRTSAVVYGASAVDAASEGHTVNLFDVAGQQPIAQLSGYSDAVYGLAFSPDGTTLAASDGNGKIRLSDTATYQTLAILDGPTKGVFNVAFSPDGGTLATSGKPVLWDLDSTRAISDLCRIVAPISPEQWARLLPDVPTTATAHEAPLSASTWNGSKSTGFLPRGWWGAAGR